MPSSTSTALLRKLKWIGIYQIVGGVIGILLVFGAGLFNSNLSTGNQIILIICSLLFAFSILAGSFCVLQNTQAYKLTLVNQYLQLFSIGAAGFLFSFASGFFVRVGVDLTNSFEIAMRFGISECYINVNREPNIILVNLNLVALGIILWLQKQASIIQKNSTEALINSIGKND